MTDYINKTEAELMTLNAAVAGGAAAGLSTFMIGTSPIAFMGISIPSALVFGAVGAVSSAFQKANRDYIIPEFTNSESPQLVALVIAPAITGLAFVAIDQVINYLTGVGFVGTPAMINVFLVGALAEMVAGFASAPVKQILEYQ